ncbi:MAG: hypothetical protein HKN12_01870 [Gemmatimonadetes bacterium]|nr:hypothetical protein [Gemmatimonadota bacterium]
MAREPDPGRDQETRERATARERSAVAKFVLAIAAPTVLMMLAVSLFTRAPAERGQRPLPAAPDSSGTFDFHHRWDEGPLVVENRLPGQEVRTRLAYERLQFMCSSFGVPESWLEAGRDSETLRIRAAERGVRVTFDGDQVYFAPDYRWIIEQGRWNVRNVARELAEAFRNTGLRSQRDFLRLTSSFVQSIEYSIPEAVRHTSTGEAVNTFGIATPIEVLRNKWGDCDSKSLLFAALLRNTSRQRVVFLIGNDHLFVGVRGVPRRGDHYVERSGVRYILIELTDRWPIGRLPDDLWRAVGRNRYQIVDP